MDDLQAILATDLTTLDDDRAAARIGELIDLAADFGDEHGLESALRWCEAVQSRSLPSSLRATLHYFEANAWSALGGLRRKGAAEPVEWSGRSAECWEKEIVSLRRAIYGPGFQELERIQQCPILTNLGNRLSSLGRFTEAIESFDRALAIDPRFGMAWGNRGITFVQLLQALPHLPHAPGLCSTAAFIQAASESLRTACSLPLQDGSEELFQAYAAFLNERPSAREESFDPTSGSLGIGKREQEYRRWSLANRLFLNPLNDLGPVPAAAEDTLHLPAVTVEIGSGPYFEGFYNQLKQEFVSARYLLYEGATSQHPHFSDARVRLYDTRDYPVYGLAGEEVKCAMRLAYSLFDKMAFFLNYYLKLGIPAKQVSFRGFWYQSQNPKQGLKSQIEGRENWPLRGLFWMSKDLYDSRPEFREAMEPEAQEIDTTRNHAEHKYLKVHDDLWPEMAGAADSLGMPEDAYYSIGSGLLVSRTLRLTKLARSALIYLAYAVHVEETRKRAEGGPGEKVLSLPIGWMEDASKVGMKARLDQPNTDNTA